MNVQARPSASLTQGLHEALAIRVIHEDRLTPVAAIPDVIDRAGMLQRQVFHAVGERFDVADFGQYLQILDGPPNRDAKLVGKDDTTEGFANTLPSRRLGQQIVILAE
ncbi:MAG: hypothetical protein KF833_14180 [Verrucomicrobiae bacterium]|nr:hypothetical protein [Verrucomicrobiae bacterium]